MPIDDPSHTSSERDWTRAPSVLARPRAAGKFIALDDRKLLVRGFTYGTFDRNEAGEPFPEPDRAESDLAAMAATGANALRTYTPPPRWLLDAAARHGLRVLVGIPWEQHVAFLDEPGRADRIEHAVRRAAQACAGHPAVLCYAVGNEIPAQVVRWSGRRRVERHIRRLYEAVKEEDPTALATYVNYPTTEYLQLDFLDIVCFNVYLESIERFSAYLKRLQNIAGDRPLLVTEIGLDSGVHGEANQARELGEQLDAAFGGGSAGAFVFSWTDEWHTGGHDIERWRFGVTTREREPKPALEAVARSFRDAPLGAGWEGPRISVVVCAHNAESTLADCLEGCTSLRYPDHEVIVVDDGSSDATAEIASRFDVRLVRTPNQGLSKARNTGIEESTGEIVAFTDADARPDPDWLDYLARSFEASPHAAIGGPNIAPPGAGPVAEAVANAPGGPVHVLLADDVAEHIPGCNMAFKRDVLIAIGGFDPRFRVAGDDVDICWRLHASGYTLGFSPAAMVWHHPRASVRGYWRQQCGYGRAEALLEEKWPEKYNSAGHVTWGGRVYGGPTRRAWQGRGRIYQGVWGTAPFQSYDSDGPGLLASLVVTPEWYLVLLGLGALSLLGLSWSPLALALPALAIALGAVLVQAGRGAFHARFTESDLPASDRRARRALTFWLHLLQPAARLRGRMRHGLTPWRLRAARRFVRPDQRSLGLWSEIPERHATRLARLEDGLRRMRAVVLRGGPFDGWDLKVKGGPAGRVRVHSCTEEHGSGRQLVRLRLVPTVSRLGQGIVAVLGLLSIAAFLDGAPVAGSVLAVGVLIVTLRACLECGAAMAAVLEGVEALEAGAAGLQPLYAMRPMRGTRSARPFASSAEPGTSRAAPDLAVEIPRKAQGAA